MKTQAPQSRPFGSETMQTYTVADARTFWSVARSKALDTFEKNRVADLAGSGVKFTLAVSLASLFVFCDYQQAVETLRKIASAGSYALPKTFGAFVIVYGWKTWYSAGKWGFSKTWEALAAMMPEEDRSGCRTVKGLDVAEVADFLFGRRAFPRDEFCKKFSASRAVHEELAAGLESVGIMVRGENNARILAAGTDRAYVESLLADVDAYGFSLRDRIKDSSGMSGNETPPSPELPAQAE